VADSEPSREYDECVDKATAVLTAISAANELAAMTRSQQRAT
jgi:anthranilate/para-aminobenzoate synthase component I